MQSGSVTILDFGENFAVSVEIDPSFFTNETITIRHGEILNADGSLYTANLRKAKAAIVYHAGAEKKTAAQMLAQATTLKEAIAVLEDGMKGTLADYTIASVTETQLMDVFPFDANSIPGEKKSGEELIAEQKQQAEQRG